MGTGGGMERQRPGSRLRKPPAWWETHSVTLDSMLLSEFQLPHLQEEIVIAWLLGVGMVTGAWVPQ